MLACLLIVPVFGVNAAINGGDEPSKNGKIAFETDRDGNVEIYTMNSDGSQQTRLTNNNYYDGEICWSPDGTKIGFTSNRDGNYEIYMMNADGTGQTRLTDNTYADGEMDWSPDGTKIAFVSYRDGNPEIYVMNTNGSGLTRLTNNNHDDGEVDWSPDGTKIAFDSDRDGNWEIYVMNADGSGQTRLTNDLAEDWNPCWSTDGSKITWDTNRDGDYEIYVMNADGSDQTRLTEIGENGYPDWSPDGTKIAFDSDRDGNWEIYVMNIDGTEQSRITNNSVDDWDPVWQRLFVTTFQQNGVDSDFSGNLLSVDGTSYTVGQLPTSFAWATGTSHDFSWSSPLTVSIDKRYVWSSTSGQSTGQSGAFTAVPGDGSIVANFTTQYYVRLIASEGGSITEPSNWVNYDGNITATPVPDQGYVFSHWQISGSIWEIIGGGNTKTFKVMGPGTVMAVFEIIDDMPPTITVISPANGSTVPPGNVTVSASYSDNGNINVSTVELRFDGTIVATGVVANATVMTYTLPLSSGAHTAELTVEDNSGNSRVATWVFAVGQPSAGFPIEYIIAIVVVVAVVAVLAVFLMRRGK